MHQRGFGEIAVRIEESKSLAGGQVLRNQIEQQSAFAGAGLTDDVEVPTPLFRVEHHEITPNIGAEK